MMATSPIAGLSDVCADLREATGGDDVDGVVPSVIAAPTATDEVSGLMRMATEHELAVVVRGAGTKLGWGLPPERLDLVVDMSGMHQLVEHAAGDLIASAQAGMPLAGLQENLAVAGQHLAVDEMVSGTSIGGLIAASPSGPRRFATGSVRDLLIGITVVRADGVVANSGGKVVKNVAGYDLGKLVIGSMGTLGVVTEATFRLHPLPESSRWLAVPAASVELAAHMVSMVLHSQVVPVAVEVVWPTDGAGTVAVLLEGSSAGVDARSRTVSNLLGGSVEVLDDPSNLLSYPWEREGDATAVKLTCQLSAVIEVLSTARDCGVHIQGSAGVGVFYGFLPGGTQPHLVDMALARLRSVCETHGGSVVVVDAPAAVKSELDVWGPVHGLELMRRVKDQFDPGHRLAPGRFVGGI